MRLVRGAAGVDGANEVLSASADGHSRSYSDPVFLFFLFLHCTVESRFFLRRRWVAQKIASLKLVAKLGRTCIGSRAKLTIGCHTDIVQRKIYIKKREFTVLVVPHTHTHTHTHTSLGRRSEPITRLLSRQKFMQVITSLVVQEGSCGLIPRT